MASITANTMARSPTGPLGTKVFVPLIRRPLPAGSARTRTAKESEAKPGSLVAALVAGQSIADFRLMDRFLVYAPRSVRLLLWLAPAAP
ncbi:MAG: hypothetical protein EPO19_11835 [Betaproteobacteria bacterium]|nr:MAG: hypothetical protein EPO19_11835 [Betaproteobacteria bacterium]